jgi:hypothetical protein
MFTTSYSVLILVSWPNPLVVLTRQVQWHHTKMSPQRHLPGTLQQTLTSHVHALYKVWDHLRGQQIWWIQGYLELVSSCLESGCHYCILSFFSLHFKDCKFITGLNGWLIDIYISVHCFRAIWVSVLDTELWQPTVIMKKRIILINDADSAVSSIERMYHAGDRKLSL